MSTGCDACNVSSRGYTVQFGKTQKTQLLDTYFSSFSQEQWQPLEDKYYWMDEPVFFGLVDYLTLHMVEEPIHAVMSDRLNPLKEIENVRPLTSFKEEREASWIDDVIRERRIVTHYQPIVSVENGEARIVGQELLSRGVDVEGKIIPPFKMFEAARTRNRLFALDRACRIECVRNAAIVDPSQLLFINFIPTAIYVPQHCLATTFDTVREVGLDAKRIVFEVIETDEVKNTEHLKSILNYYHNHGFNYALDDVGVGYNNLNMLNQMNPHVIKLAFEFTNGVATDTTKQNIAKAVATIAKEMGAKALAEGVERREDLEYLQALGYELFQGYYFAKPQEKPLVRL